MAELSPAIAERARKNERVVLHALASAGQRHAADLMGVSESTVSRFKEALIAQFCAFLAALGLKVVPIGMQCFDPSDVAALMHGHKRWVEGLREPTQLQWGDE